MVGGSSTQESQAANPPGTTRDRLRVVLARCDRNTSRPAEEPRAFEIDVLFITNHIITGNIVGRDTTAIPPRWYSEMEGARRRKGNEAKKGGGFTNVNLALLRFGNASSASTS